MPVENDDATIQKTEWTGALLEDLCAALRGKRDDSAVRGFAQELMGEKHLRIEYLVRKVEENVGTEAAKRLDVLIRGKHAVEKSKAEQPKGGGVVGFVRKLFS